MYEALFTRGGLSLERLKTLCEVASRGGIAKAADGDPVRQSQFSRQLRELEEFFGIELTQRRGRNAELTAAGLELARLGREILDALSSYATERRGDMATLRLGAGESLLQWVVLPRIGSMRSAIPRTVFSFHNLRGAEVLTQLQESRLDFGLVAGSDVPVGIKASRLGVLRYRLFVSHRCGEETARLDWRAVMRRPFVGLEGDGRQIRAIREISERHGLPLQQSVLCSSLPSVAMVLEQHEGFAILPEAAKRQGLIAVEAPFLAKLQRTISLAWSERRLATRTAMPKWRRALADELKWP
jgi:DNA-binding transcriptional LysR family regulator